MQLCISSGSSASDISGPKDTHLVSLIRGLTEWWPADAISGADFTAREYTVAGRRAPMSIVFVIVAFVMLVLAGFVLARRRATSAAPKPKPGLGVSVHDQYLRMIANETLDERVERLKSGM
jgi:hypothetical protein